VRLGGIENEAERGGEEKYCLAAVLVFKMVPLVVAALVMNGGVWCQDVQW